MANDLTNHAYVMKPPLKPLYDGVLGAPGLVKVWKCWEGGTPREGIGALPPFPHTLSHTSLHQAAPELYAL